MSIHILIKKLKYQTTSKLKYKKQLIHRSLLVQKTLLIKLKNLVALNFTHIDHAVYHLCFVSVVDSLITYTFPCTTLP